MKQTLHCYLAGITPNEKIEQRVNLKLLVKLKKKTSPMECIKLLKDMHGDNLTSRSRVFEWHKRFTKGWEELEDDLTSRSPFDFENRPKHSENQ